MSAAKKELLERMHNAFAEVLLKAVEEGTPLLLPDGSAVVDAKGQPLKGPPPAALLNQVRQFLKDNDVKALVVQGSRLDELGRAFGDVTLAFEGSEPPAH